MGESYGFFEIPSTTAAINAIDVMCKTASVELVTWEKKLGGRLVTVIIKGNVSAVTQAIESANNTALIKPAGSCVIPSPHEEVIKIINSSVNRVD
ncbi:ethanolamine utilization protein EutM [Lachnospiraceae bacterium PF1-21]|uniref:BMC domain-containing protein n=1 Tax=Ohessyouella blattaphilus TaxID=2949333 RepID=A0ABT1EE15_9FIRM|nr:BMC domain-containing protein [Ohessyouella blattaphilus]MCP1108945.1 BMC domain-containing protein [Ohessyouella blattaphilus]MCR8562339.1 BMC domain-containing protein [Ohessyouella blattaphilus]MDL2249893.1 BMC domain-containing protein [Lachnospiraceae bacterium OttesenSCG-928-J05]